MPYIGYFQLINAVHKFVILDDVNFIKGGWANRNFIIVNNAKYRFSIPIKKVSDSKKFNELEFIGDFSKFSRILNQYYKKTLFYHQTMNLIDEILSYHSLNVSEFISNSIVLICKYLSIDTKILISSKLNNNKTLKREERIIDICNILNSNNYINAIGGKNLYNKQFFESKNISLSFLECNPKPYTQTSSYFIPNLSIIDILMNIHPDKIASHLNSYTLK